ncbi:MAG: hypothetical protein U1F53_20790 [Burkholderiaceae bacterium]
MGHRAGPGARNGLAGRGRPAAAAAFGLATGRGRGGAPRRAGGVRQPACRGLLWGTAIAWAGDEVPLADAGDALRIDRLVAVDEPGQPRTWWVLDYKLEPRPQDDADNLAQLDRYRRLVAALQPGEPVRAAFVTGRGERVDLPLA